MKSARAGRPVESWYCKEVAKSILSSVAIMAGMDDEYFGMAKRDTSGDGKEFGDIGCSGKRLVFAIAPARESAGKVAASGNPAPRLVTDGVSAFRNGATDDWTLSLAIAEKWCERSFGWGFREVPALGTRGVMLAMINLSSSKRGLRGATSCCKYEYWATVIETEQRSVLIICFAVISPEFKR